MLPFMNLPAQSPINLRADAYAEVSVRLSRLVAMTTRCVLDVPYGDHPEQRLDIYLPADPSLRDLPVFVNIHGGAWTHGFKEWMGLNAPPVVAVPAIYVSLGYRLAPHARFPAPFDDCLAAFAWVFRNIAKHGGSPDRLFVGGHSAGGQLAALIALRTDLHARHGLPTGVVKGCLPTSGVFDMTYLKEDGTRALVPMCAGTMGDTRLERDASPVHWTAGNETPFLVSWGENDNPFCKAQAPLFAEALRTAPGRVETQVLPILDHFWVTVDQQRPENPYTRTLVAWMTGDPRTAPVFQA
jgi:acetyl esterase/lipase